jgi:hypothetical protein
MESKPLCDQIILIHGTAAADVADRGSRWWQFESDFHTWLRSRLAGFSFGKPFHWSGANLENERDEAALVLLERLRKLDGKVGYHLIAHSHGGSVAWRCLVASARQGRRLEGLRSWTTIGTPFITFRSISTSIWLLMSSLIALVLLAICLFPDRPGEVWSAIQRLRQTEQTASLLIYYLLVAVLGLVAIFATVLVLQPIIAWLRDRSLDEATRRAGQWYGTKWLGLWHPLDEPINLLAGSLGAAPAIAPRLSSTSLLSFVPFVVPLYDGLFARAADEFIWSKVVERAQGSNIVGRRAFAVSRAPPALSPGWGPIPEVIASRITERCDVHAGRTVNRMRATFEGAYDTQGSEVVFSALARTVTFQELIHTSYFDDDGVRGITAEWIGLQAGHEPKPTAHPLAFPIKLDEASLADVAVSRLPNNRRRLDFAFALGLITLSGLLATAILSFYDAKISPATDRYQLESIATMVRRPAVNSVGSEDALPAVLMRLELLGIAKRAEDFLDDIGDAITRQNAAEGVGYALGYAGQFDRLDSVALRSQNASFAILAVKAAAVSGAAVAGHKPPDDLIEELRAQFVRKAAGSSMRTVANALIAFYGRSGAEQIGQLIKERGATTVLSAPIVPPNNPSLDVTDDCYLAFVVSTTRLLTAEERNELRKMIDCKQPSATWLTGSILRTLVDEPHYPTIIAITKGTALETVSIKDLLLELLGKDDAKLSDTILKLMYIIEIEKAYDRFAFEHLSEAYDGALQDHGRPFVMQLMTEVGNRLAKLGDENTAKELFARIENDLPKLYEEQAQSYKNTLFAESTIAAFRGLIAHLAGTGRRNDAAWWTRQTYSVLLDRKDSDENLKTLWYAAIAEAARTLKLDGLAKQAIEAGLAVKEPTPREPNVRGAIELGMASMALRGDDLAGYTRAAFEKATDWLNRVSEREGLELDVVKLVSAWSRLGELPRAREIAEHAPSKRATLASYVAMLDVALQNSKVKLKPAQTADVVGKRYSLESVMIEWQ